MLNSPPQKTVFFAWATQHTSRYIRLAMFLVIVGVLFGSYCFLYFGVDFSDEANSLAIPYRFVLGDRPFVDEWNIAQTSGLLIYPLVKLFYLLRASSEGLVLCFRHLYLILSCVVAWIVYQRAKAVFDPHVALLSALICVPFVPGAIPNLTYNTMGSLFFVTGIFFSLAGISKKRDHLWILAGGVCHGLSMIAHPSLSIPCMLYALIGLWFQRGKLKYLLLYGIGAAAAFSLMLPTVLDTTPAHILHALRISGKWGKALTVFVGAGPGPEPTFFEKGLLLAKAFWTGIPSVGFIAALLACLSYKRYPLVSLIIFGALPVILYLPFRRADGSYIIYYSLLAPFCYWRLRDQSVAKTLFWGVWLPSIVGGITSSLTSSTGLRGAQVSLLCGVIVVSLFLGTLMHGLRVERFRPICRWLAFLSQAVVLMLFLVDRRYVYSENFFRGLTTRVSGGPYRGLLTSAEKNQFLSDLSRDLKELENRDGKILFMDHFPAGYLLTSMRPAAKYLFIPCGLPWTPYSEEDRAMCARDYGEQLSERNIVVKLTEHHWPIKNDPLETLVYAYHEKVVSHPKYEIYSTVREDVNGPRKN